MSEIKVSVKKIIAEHIIASYDRGESCLTVDEILTVLKKEDRPKNSQVPDLFRLTRRYINRRWKLVVVSVSPYFFEPQTDLTGEEIRPSFKDRRPRRGEEHHARLCIATGGNYPIAGLYVPDRKGHDIILEEFIRRVGYGGLRTENVAIRDAYCGVENGVLDRGRISKTLADTRDESSRALAYKISEDRIDEAAEKGAEKAVARIVSALSGKDFSEVRGALQDAFRSVNGNGKDASTR